MKRAVLAFVCLTTFSFAEEKWVEVRSPNFSVATNAGEKRGREIALRFEQMRRVFTSFIPRDKLNLSAPLQIVAFRNNAQLKQVAPLFDGKPVEVSGLYFGGGERNYIALDAWSDSGWRPVFHEYAHLLLNTNYPQTPAWFDEGFAEYYSTVRADKKSYHVGEFPEEYAPLLANHRLMPVEQLFAVEHRSEDYNKSGTRRSMFYVQSWLTVHYIFDNKKLPQTAEYFSLRRTLSIPEAMQRAFGMTPKEFDKELQKYLSAARIMVYTLPIPAGLEEVTYVARKMKPHEGALLVADLHLNSSQHLERAMAEYQQIITQEPYFSAAHRGLGYAYFRKGDHEQAQKSFRRAADLDSDDPRVYYFIAHYLLRQADGVNDPEILVEANQNLDKALKLDPAYAEAYDLKGLALGRAQSSAEAIKVMRRAVELNPRNEAFQFNLASTYMGARKFEEATALFEKLQRSESDHMRNMAAQQLRTIAEWKTNPLSQLAAELPDRHTNPQWRRKGASKQDEELEKLEQAQAGGDDEPEVDPRKVRFARGLLVESHCTDDGRVSMQVRIGPRNVNLKASNVKKMVVIGADNFECSWKNKRISVNYRETTPMEGDLMSLEVTTR